jgi:hypothetical protein
MPDRAALIALLIVYRPLCLDCIAARVNMPTDLTASYLARLRTVAGYREEDGDRCRACGTVGKVYSFTRPAL